MEAGPREEMNDRGRQEILPLWEENERPSSSDNDRPSPSLPFVDRLSELTRLESIHFRLACSQTLDHESRFQLFGADDYEGPWYACQKLNLGGETGGLDRLKSLKNLQALKTSYTGQVVSMVEAQWMVAHWPRIKTIELRQDVGSYEMREGAIPKFFKSHGVKFSVG